VSATRRYRRRRHDVMPTPEGIHVGPLVEMFDVDPDEVGEAVADLEDDNDPQDPFLALPEAEVLAYLTTWMGRCPAPPKYRRLAARSLYDWWRAHQPKADRPA
jgi:hypothetical protein